MPMGDRRAPLVSDAAWHWGWRAAQMGFVLPKLHKAIMLKVGGDHLSSLASGTRTTRAGRIDGPALH